MSPRMRSHLIVALLLLSLVPFSGCLTYSDVLADAHEDAAGGDWSAAEQRLNRLLGVESREEIPEYLESDETLAALERAIVLQAQGAWQESLRDLSSAEAGLEEIDFDRDIGGNLATYLYSGSEANYSALPVERMALNSFNMLNYLALGRLQDAAVEARRYQVMRNYLEGIEDAPPGRFGAFLSGFVFEHLGEADRALRYYEEVLAGGPVAALDLPIARLATRTRWRGPHTADAVARVRATRRVAGPAARGVDADPEGAAGPRVFAPTPSSEILFVASLGRSPRRVAKRIPVGAAVGLAGAYVTGDLAILQRSVLKVVVYPEIEPVPSRVTGANLSVNGVRVRPDVLDRLGQEVMADYEKARPILIGQALSRMIVRAAAAEGARAASNEYGGLIALATEAALLAMDRPDTRSWSFLPDQILVARIPVRPGRHEVRIDLAGSGETLFREVDVAEDSFATVVITDPR